MAMIRRFALGLFFLLSLMRAAQAAPDDLPSLIVDIEQQWAQINYQLPLDQQVAPLKALAQRAQIISRQFPGEPLPLVWHGMILCSYAEAHGGLEALDSVTQARDLFLQAKKIDPHVMNGTVDGYLGTLYYRVPGWPIGFGDNKKAAQYFQQAMAENPGSVDTNFLYGQFLAVTGDKAAARRYLTAALAVPIRADHADYDAGRRQDITGVLATLK